MEEKGINVLSLFNGMGCAWLALDRLGVKVNKRYSSEIDKYANIVNDYNYPDTIQLGSVVDVDVSKLEKIDLIVGGSPCFIKGTLVITKDEIKNIEDVKVGDYVLTHTNTFQKVLKVGGKKSQEILSVLCQGIVKIGTTKEHPFYIREMSRVWDRSKRTSFRKFSEPTWKKAEDLKHGDFVGLNILNTSENKLNITKEDAYIIGRYIADGHTRKDTRLTENRPNDRYWQLILSIGDSKVEAFKSKIKENHFSCHSHSKSVKRVIFSSKRLVKIVESNCGSGAVNKYLSMDLLNLPKEILSHLIDGYLDGDGCCKNGKTTLTSISSKLITTISIAIAKVYGVGFNYSFVKTPDTCIIEGRTVNQKDYHILGFQKEITKGVRFKIINGKVWLPFKSSIVEDNKQDVFNLEVDIDNSYTANGIIVHNCQSFSFAGKRAGMTTTDNEEILSLDHYLRLKAEGFEFEGQSYLFWEYMRILTEIRKVNPDVKFLLENVEMGEKWEKVLSRAIGVNGIHINSALVSAQNRKRVYWIGQNRERLFYFDNLCYVCRKKDNEQKRQFRILGKAQREGEEKVLGKTQKRHSNMRNVPKRLSQNRKKGDHQNLFNRMPISIEETNRQESGQSEKKNNPLKIHQQEQGEVVTISERLQEDTKRERSVEEIRNNRIKEENQINISQNIQGTWSKEENEIRRNSHIAKYGEKVCCVQCGIGLDSGSYTSVITRGNKHSNEPTNTLSEMQFNEARQNNGRVFDIFKVGVVDACLFGERIIDPHQPKDRGILLKDILETNVDEKYFLSDKMMQYFNNRATNFNNGKINIRKEEGKSTTLTASMASCDISDNFIKIDKKGEIKNNQDKASCFTAGGNSGGNHSDMDLIVVHNTMPRSSKTNKGGTGPNKDNLVMQLNEKQKANHKNEDEKANAFLSTSFKGSQANGMTLVGQARIRRLTPTEAARLQTVPDNYFKDKDGNNLVSETQQYKMLGNGFTIEVIAHLLAYFK